MVLRVSMKMFCAWNAILLIYQPSISLPDSLSSFPHLLLPVLFQQTLQSFQMQTVSFLNHSSTRLKISGISGRSFYLTCSSPHAYFLLHAIRHNSINDYTSLPPSHIPTIVLLQRRIHLKSISLFHHESPLRSTPPSYPTFASVSSFATPFLYTFKGKQPVRISDISKPSA